MPKIKQKNIGSKEPATKGDIEDLREDLHVDMMEYTMSREELKAEFEKSEERLARRVVAEMQAIREKEIQDLEAVHQDEIDVVGGEKKASPQWKSIPRRLKTVEMDVEKIKDRLS